MDTTPVSYTHLDVYKRQVEARCYPADVSAEQQVIGAMDAIVHDFGRFDVIVNNAGIVNDSLLIKVKDGVVSDRMSLRQWQAVVDVNLTGVFLCGREAAAHMVKFGAGGVIINISSISRHGNIGQTNYAATKAGVAAMTVVWAKELARYGIRAGAIAPGFTNTEILSGMRPEVLQKVIAPVPLRRLGDPAETVSYTHLDVYKRQCVHCTAITSASSIPTSRLSPECTSPVMARVGTSTVTTGSPAA